VCEGGSPQEPCGAHNFEKKKNSGSHRAFVKGTKDINKTFLKTQVREGIGTMYLFLIVPHLEVLKLVVCEGSNVEVMCQRCHL
jgi:hypothetical protein